MWNAIFARLLNDHELLVSAIQWNLLLTDVGATAVVLVGLRWEAESLIVRHKIGRAFVLWGIVGEMLATVLLFAFDQGISGAQQSKIIVLETRLSDAAFAIAPRYLLDATPHAEVFMRQSEASRKFPTIRAPRATTSVFRLNNVYIQAVSDREAQILKNDLKLLLEDTDWHVELLDETKTGINPADIPEGVSIIAVGGPLPSDAYQQLLENGKRICAALTTEGRLTDWSGGPLHILSRMDDRSWPGMPSYPDPDRFHEVGIFIEIGVKPVYGMLQRALSHESHIAPGLACAP